MAGLRTTSIMRRRHDRVDRTPLPRFECFDPRGEFTDDCGEFQRQLCDHGEHNRRHLDQFLFSRFLSPTMQRAVESFMNMFSLHPRNVWDQRWSSRTARSQSECRGVPVYRKHGRIYRFGVDPRTRVAHREDSTARRRSGDADQKACNRMNHLTRDTIQ